MHERTARASDQVEAQIRGSERQIEHVVKETLAMQLLMIVPVIEKILAVVIAMQVGDVNRFSDPKNLANYAVLVLPVKASEDKLIHSPVRPDVNRYLKWALTEAANTIAIFYKRWIGHHVAFIYLRFREKKGHAKDLVAVARHLAEPTYFGL